MKLKCFGKDDILMDDYVDDLKTENEELRDENKKLKEELLL